MGRITKRVHKRRRCCQCGKPALREIITGTDHVRIRAWCRLCLERIRYWGVADADEYPSQEDARRLRAVVSW